MDCSGKILKCLQILVFLKLFSIRFLEARSNDVVINQFSYKIHKPDYFKKVNISEQFRNHRKSMHFEVEFAKPVIAFDAQLALARYSGSGSPFKLFNVTVNGCQSLNTAVKNRVFKSIMKAMQYGNSNFPKRCPIKENTHYVIDQFYLHPEDFAFLSDGFRALTNFSWVVQKQQMFSLNLDFSRKSA